LKINGSARAGMAGIDRRICLAEEMDKEGIDHADS
jgi:hypothetical protein